MAHAQSDPIPGTPDSLETTAPVTTAGAGFAVTGVADRPPPPSPPAVIARDALGRATVRAVRLASGLRLDGVLDEPAYEVVPAIDDFIQQEPNEGAPASETTEAWVFFDAENIYVAARLWDSEPPSAWVANEMQRDTPQLRENDTFWVAFDTFNDRRNGIAFYTNPLGALGDFAITNEGNPNGDWNPVWDVRTGRFEGGWTVEMEIPFKSVRYRPGPAPVWGIQFRRMVRRKNERSYLTPVPISAGRRGLFRVSDAALLVGLEVPNEGNVLEIKPYAIGGSTTDVNVIPPTAWNGDGGVDLKYGITQNLTADFTYNTDFAQVEVDEQQVNLTRFSLFFPEKREFFLEGRGIFEFARGGGPSSRSSALRQIGGGGRSSRGSGNAPTLFYSRRIGLQDGAVVPIVGGGRVTGKVGDFDVGLLNIQTAGRPGAVGAESTNFAVVRLKRDVLRRSAVGALFTNRSASVAGRRAGANRVFGADATLAFFENVSVVSYVARTQTPGFEGRDSSYQGQFMYAADRYGLTAEHLVVEDNFIPEVGFLRRDNFRRSYLAGRFSPRPASLEAVRQFRLEAGYEHILTADTGILETKQAQVGFSTEFETSDRLGMTLADNYEFLVRPVRTGTGRRPAGGRLRVPRRRGDVPGRGPAPADGDRHGARRRVLQREHPVRRLQPGTSGGDPGAVHRADPVGELDRHAAGLVPHPSDRLPHHLHLLAPHVLRRADPVQLRRQHGEHQPAPALGVQPRQRALRRLYRRPRQRPVAARPLRRLLRASQSRPRGEGEPAVPLLGRKTRRITVRSFGAGPARFHTMRARTIFATLGLAALLASGLSAQGRPTAVERDPAPTFTSGVDMVTVHVSVRDRRGRIVRDLSPADFRLKDRRLRPSHRERLPQRRGAQHRRARRHQRQHGASTATSTGPGGPWKR